MADLNSYLKDMDGYYNSSLNAQSWKTVEGKKKQGGSSSLVRLENGKLVGLPNAQVTHNFDETHHKEDDQIFTRANNRTAAQTDEEQEDDLDENYMIDYTKHNPKNLAQDWETLGQIQYQGNVDHKDYYLKMKAVTDDEF